MIFVLSFCLIIQVTYGEEFCFANVTLLNKFDPYKSLQFSALYSTHSQSDEIRGRLVLAKSYSILNHAQIVSNGCSKYLNKPTNYNYISLIDQTECSFDEKIENAIQSNALGLIIISKNSQIFKIKTSKCKL